MVSRVHDGSKCIRRRSLAGHETIPGTQHENLFGNAAWLGRRSPVAAFRFAATCNRFTLYCRAEIFPSGAEIRGTPDRGVLGKGGQFDQGSSAPSQPWVTQITDIVDGLDHNDWQ